MENEEVSVMWDINALCDKVIEARRPDIILIDKKERKGRKRKGENGKVPGLKERDWKIMETQNDRSRSCSDTSPWKCHKRI